MDEEQADSHIERQLGALQNEAADLREQLGKLNARLEAADFVSDERHDRAVVERRRTDQLEVRADAGDVRASEQARRSDDQDLRMDGIRADLDVDREMIHALQAEGLVRDGQVKNLQEALRTARLIGAAIGIVMASTKVDQPSAFEALRRASMDRNRKLRDVAEQLVLTGTLDDPTA
ncbi:ANTAR domain-containing protein [Pedococcus dokdonensis]|uniref:ANTAR domain-containing protein n=1 Tax=Pedococcus dokdonensis TaxID=443156 RepID=A0A1H0MMW9_9MICO|nr:ANTAR domain-containing protein [Pedococcus dokdonensis]SDO81727.1 ANTAR domain-containing protein [Pedococcus dokdonensis]